MRTEQEMMELILDVAKSDENIRAVYLNGSRANPRVRPDKCQDYDIVYVVEEIGEYDEMPQFLSQFGKPLIVQRPENENPTWLMLFEDGIRIDLQMDELTKTRFGKDSLTVLLLDKDRIFPQIPTANDSDYWIKKPTKAEFSACTNEFWWCLNNVAKGIKRKQLSYAMRMYMETVHLELERMMDWCIASEHKFKCSTGMWGKEISAYLPEKIYEKYKLTYPSADEKIFWEALLVSCELFHLLAIEVANNCDFIYNKSEEDGMRKYLEMMKEND